jgi:hypothetical protein
VFDLRSEQFYLGEVGKTGGTQNLYYNAKDTDPMRIEHLFSKLECKTSSIFRKINIAITEGHDHIDILEKDIHVLFKFMNLSLRRSQQYRDEVKNPHRENDFIFQQLFDASEKSGRSSDPGQFWLDHLLYLLETSHEDTLADAVKTVGNSAAISYKYFIESYALQIWRAADGHEFFLNDGLVDFEGDTQSCLGTEVGETGAQLIWMTTADLNHLILPISPEVAIIFCDESRCWDSPFADTMHQLKIPYPQNSLLEKAPHMDIINVHVPSEKRGKKTWPATVAWRVHIGILSQEHHQIITSYSLSHAKSFIVVQRRAQFERAKRAQELFSQKRAEVWKSQGIRFGYQHVRRKHQAESPSLSQEQMTTVVDNHMSALEEIFNIIQTTHKPLQRTKDNAFKSWLAFRALESYRASLRSPTESLHLDVIHPFLKAAFIAAYSPKHPNHKDIVTIDFGQFFTDGIGEETFAKLALKIELKISELVHADTFQAHWEANVTNSYFPEGSHSQKDGEFSEQPTGLEEDLLSNPSFKSVFKAAEGFRVLKWMFEERQDILATFIQQIAVPMKATQSDVIRIRGRRG